MPTNNRTRNRKTQNLGVFKNNRLRPIHRWYPFVEGYSADLVERALLSEALNGGVVFDPFGGCGTTALAVALAGKDSYFAEVNPYLAWVAKVKVNHARAAVDDPGLNRLHELAKLIDAGLDVAIDEDHPLVVADRKRSYFPPGVAGSVITILEWIDQELSGAPAELARLACATSLIPSSHMIRRTDLRRRRPGDPLPADFRVEVTARLRAIIEDVISTGPLIAGEAHQAASDVRHLTTLSSKIDLIVTSPPYLNGTNYCRNTKLELLALGLFESEGDLAQLRTESITAGINNVSSRKKPPTLIHAVEKIASRLDDVAYDQRIPALVRGYFSDMSMALATLRSHSSSGARFFLDIGDSRFAGIHVPTHKILAQLAGETGWLVVRMEELRSRQSYDGTRLTQVLLEMRAA